LAVQKKIPTFLGAEGGGGLEGGLGAEVLAEEAEIKAESEAAVGEARRYLSGKFSDDALRLFWEQSAARVVLHKQREVVRKMIAERAISKTAAADMLQQITQDGYALEHKRIEMHKAFIRSRQEVAGSMKKVNSGAKLNMAVVDPTLLGEPKAGNDVIPSPLHGGDHL